MGNDEKGKRALCTLEESGSWQGALGKCQWSGRFRAAQ